MNRQEEVERRVRREVKRLPQRDTEGSIQPEEPQNPAPTGAGEQKPGEPAAKTGRTWGQILSGLILWRLLRRNYPYLLIVAVICFGSISMLLHTLSLDRRYAVLDHQVQLLRERSVRLEEQRATLTTRSAIVEQLRIRNMDLQEPAAPAPLIENEP